MELSFSHKNICRVCLEDGANLSLFDDEEEIKLFLKIMACATVQIREEDGFPGNICPICYNMLNTAFEFKQRCENSDYKLRNCEMKEDVKIERDDFECPEDDVFTGDYNSDDDVKNFDPRDEIKLFDIAKVKHEVKSHKKKVTKKKRKWKASDKQSLADIKEKSVSSKLTSSKCRKKCTSNLIATSLLEGTCVWNGKDWRFDTEGKALEVFKTKEEPEELSRLLKEKEDMLKPKKLRKRVKKEKKEKALSVNLCDTCGQTFKSKYHLKYHTMLKHQEIAGNIKCKDPDCKKMFKLDHYMQRHLKRCHSTRREFICNECGKQYAFVSGLKQHMKSHSGTEVWRHCSFCTQKYRTQKSVDIHIRSVHTGERPSVCTMCDSAFFHDDYLKEHMRLHTGETPYKCPICKRGYAQRGNMKSHMKQHRMSELDDTTKASMKPNYLKLLRDC